MSNYALSVLAKGQSTVSEEYQSPEQRRKLPTVMELALKNSQISIPDANELRKDSKRPVEIYYQTNIAPGSATTKAALHTGTYGDSGKVELVYVRHVETFSLPRKIAFNNILTYQAMFTNLYRQKWQNLRTRHNTSALNFLFANRCQLAAADMNPQIASAAPGTWNEIRFGLEVAAADKARFAQRIKSLMMARAFTGNYDLVADLQTAAELEFQRNQGQGNSTNTSFQFSDLNIATTQEVVDSNYTKGAGLILPMGLFSGMYWNEGLNKEGVNSGENEVGMIGTQSDPFGSGAVADVSMYTKRADTSANTTGGSTQDIVDQWELSLEIAYALPPLSVTGDSVVHLVAQA